MSNFRVGQKVVCIDSSGYAKGILHRGDIYDIIEMSPHPEIIRVNAWADHFVGGNGWFKSRFRPLVSRKTDISLFKEILAGTRQPEGVEA